MGMTIDEALNLLNNSKPKSNNAFSIQMNEAINVIGITMRKYQEIEQIVSNFREYQKGISCGFGGATYMQMVSEVIADRSEE